MLYRRLWDSSKTESISQIAKEGQTAHFTFAYVILNFHRSYYKLNVTLQLEDISKHISKT